MVCVVRSTPHELTIGTDPQCSPQPLEIPRVDLAKSVKTWRNALQSALCEDLDSMVAASRGQSSLETIEASMQDTLWIAKHIYHPLPPDISQL